MRMLIALCAITLVTAACNATNPVRPQQTVFVDVPVPVPCLEQPPEDVPKSSAPDPDTADVAQLAAAAVKDATVYRLYAERAHALLIKCAQPVEEK